MALSMDFEQLELSVVLSIPEDVCGIFDKRMPSGLGFELVSFLITSHTAGVLNKPSVLP